MKQLWVLLCMTLTLYAGDEGVIQKMQKELQHKLLNLYPTMSIEKITIKRYTSPPKEFDRYKLATITISSNNLKRDKGSLSATFTYKSRKRKLYYHYKVNAIVTVLKANQYIQRGKTITDTMVDFVPIKFTNFYQVPITTNYLNNYRARTTLVEGKILTTKHVAKITDIKRGDMLNTTLRDGGVSVTFQAQALKDAYIGDVIKVKRNHKSFFHVRITSSTTAEVTK